MEFDSQEDHDKCVTMLKEMVGGDIRDVKPVSEGTLKRLLGE